MLSLHYQYQNRLIMQRLMLWVLFLATSLGLSAKSFQPYFHSVKIKSGDAISTLLARYELSANTCNVDKFYELNDMKRGAMLLAHKEYKLPIKVFYYNGKSIRSTLKMEDVDSALEIQKYNERLHKKGLRNSSFKDSRKLWVPYHKLGCDSKEEEAPLAMEVKNAVKKNDKIKAGTEKVKEDKEVAVVKVKSTTGKSASKPNGKFEDHEIFGDKYRNVNMFDDQLAGQVFYISSGHGGPDPGAQCTDLAHTLCEDEYAYDVSLRLARDLIQHGATVHMIIQDENDGIRDDAFLDCDNDENCNGKNLPLRQLDRLKQRADHINRLYKKYKKQGVKKQTAIMIHVDSRNEEQRQDVFFYHYGTDKDAKDLAYNLQSTFESKYDQFQKGRGYKGYVDNRGLYMLRKVDPTAVYVELANIRNKSDHIRLMEYANRQALANWLFEGLTGIQ